MGKLFWCMFEFVCLLLMLLFWFWFWLDFAYTQSRKLELESRYFCSLTDKWKFVEHNF